MFLFFFVIFHGWLASRQRRRGSCEAAQTHIPRTYTKHTAGVQCSSRLQSLSTVLMIIIPRLFKLFLFFLSLFRGDSCDKGQLPISPPRRPDTVITWSFEIRPPRALLLTRFMISVMAGNERGFHH